MNDGKAEGKGTYNGHNFKFDGLWHFAKPQSGILTFYEDKNVSEIEFINFVERKAIIKFMDQRVYEGEIDRSKFIPDGYGKVTFPSFSLKKFYEGSWK